MRNARPAWPAPARLVLAAMIMVSGASSIARDADGGQGAAIQGAPAWADEADPLTPVVRGVEPEADRLLKAMSDYIAAAAAFTFTIELAEQVLLPHGQTVTYGGVEEVAVQRPGSLHVRSRGQERNVRVVIRDGRCTLHDIETNVYAVAEVPTRIGDAIDVIVERYGLNVPVADIVYEDPYAAVIAAVDYGYVVGTTSIDGVECHQLAFAQETIDWQAWIETGPRPLLRKLVITYKDEPGSPDYTARLRDWKLVPRLSPHHFEFEPPAGAERVEFLPAEDADATLEGGS